jgi:hypothetical protein
MSLLGLEPRRFREMILRHAIPHARDGRLYLVRLGDFESAIERMMASPAPEAEPVATVDSMLALMGMKRAA